MGLRLDVHTYGPRSPYIPIMGLGVHLYGPAISVGFVVDTYGPGPSALGLVTRHELSRSKMLPGRNPTSSLAFVVLLHGLCSWHGPHRAGEKERPFRTM